MIKGNNKAAPEPQNGKRISETREESEESESGAGSAIAKSSARMMTGSGSNRNQRIKNLVTHEIVNFVSLLAREQQPQAESKKILQWTV